LRAIVFCGPTLPAEEARSILNAEVRPPAARGDVLRAALDAPSAIGLVDGYFSRVPSVWHKEILWAMSRGIRVFGAASMGALRAAELAVFGMEGVGAIFEQFASGELSDDDEVAVVHASSELNYRPLSEAMVNIRATLAAARRDGIVGDQTAARLELTAKHLEYPERSYRALLEEGAKARLDSAELARFEGWLVQGRVDQKRVDALAMLARMADMSDVPAPKVHFEFARTQPWQALSDEVAATRDAGSSARTSRDSLSEVVEELWLTDQAVDVHDAALARRLVRADGLQLMASRDRAAMAAVVDEFRRERGLLSQQAFEAWLSMQGLAGADVEQFFESEFQLRRAQSIFGESLMPSVIDQLRATGQYAALQARAREKRRVLAANGLDTPELADTWLSEEQLWVWYFDTRGQAVPLDLDAYARGQRTTLTRLRRVVVRERCYWRLQQSSR
jgi:hypothetical protein